MTRIWEYSGLLLGLEVKDDTRGTCIRTAEGQYITHEGIVLERKGCYCSFWSKETKTKHHLQVLTGTIQNFNASKI
jgi:hypothetical protein